MTQDKEGDENIGRKAWLHNNNDTRDRQVGKEVVGQAGKGRQRWHATVFQAQVAGRGLLLATVTPFCLMSPVPRPAVEGMPRGEYPLSSSSTLVASHAVRLSCYEGRF